MFSLLREFNDDPFFSSMESMRRMESMMDGMMSPFGLFGAAGGQNQQQLQRAGSQPNMLMPFGFGGSLFPSMDNMFANFSQMGNNPNCHSFSSSSVMTYTTDESGRPQMYQASASTRTAPGGVKETRRTVHDSRTGLQEMAIGHHLNDKGHVIEKKKNRYTGDAEENEEFINLDDDEAEDFNKEWQEKAQVFNNSRNYHRSIAGYENAPRSPPQLAITDGAVSSPEHSGAAKKKSNKHKRRHHGTSHKTSNRPSPYQ